MQLKMHFFRSRTNNDETRLNLTKSEIKRLIFNFNLKSSYSFALKRDLVHLMLTQTNTFKDDDFVGIADLCYKIAQSVGTPQQAILMLSFAERIDTKLNTKGQNWIKLIGEQYELLMNTAGESFVAISFCQDALKCYKQIKDTIKLLNKKTSGMTLNKQKPFLSSSTGWASPHQGLP